MARKLTKRQREKKLEKVKDLQRQIAEYEERIELAEEADPFGL